MAQWKSKGGAFREKEEAKGQGSKALAFGFFTLLHPAF
jgi:hypothetical protein